RSSRFWLRVVSTLGLALALMALVVLFDSPERTMKASIQLGIGPYGLIPLKAFWYCLAGWSCIDMGWRDGKARALFPVAALSLMLTSDPGLNGRFLTWAVVFFVQWLIPLYVWDEFFNKGAPLHTPRAKSPNEF
ncbi:MAG: hypothetical protein ACAH95_10225, partial [Fimbriimonas sp.]